MGGRRVRGGRGRYKKSFANLVNNVMVVMLTGDDVAVMMMVL